MLCRQCCASVSRSGRGPCSSVPATEADERVHNEHRTQSTTTERKHASHTVQMTKDEGNQERAEAAARCRQLLQHNSCHNRCS